MTATTTAATSRTEYTAKSLVFTVSDLRERVRQCLTIIPRKVQAAEYAAVRIEATGDRVTMFAACNGRQVLADVRSGEASEDMVLAVNAADLASAIKTAPKASCVTLAVSTDTVTVTTDTSAVTLDLTDWADIPAEPITVTGAAYTIAADELLPALKRVIPIAGKIASRYAMDAVNFNTDHDTGAVYLEATNGHHLAAVRCEYLTTDRGPTVAILAEDCKVFLKLKTPKFEAVRIASNESVAAITADGVTLTLQVREGVFPDAWSVIPAPTPTVITVPGDELATACKRAKAIAPADPDACKESSICFTVCGWAVRLEATRYTSGEAFDAESRSVIALSGATYVGDVPKVRIPTTAIGDVTKGLGDVRVYLDTASRPLLITGDAMTYVVMPLSG